MQVAVKLLEGVRVLDVSRGIAGNFAARQMADLGADVILVEPPGGIPSRGTGPFPGDRPDPDASGTFLYLNLGKRAVTLHLDTDAGRHIFRELCSEVNAVITDVPAEEAIRLGLDLESLGRDTPGLVVTMVSHLGRGGPYEHHQSVELTDMAMSGHVNLLGRPDREPVKFGGEPGQFLGGYAAFGATMAGVYEAEVSGTGQVVEVSIRDALALSHVELFCRYAYTGQMQERGYQQLVYPCKDGYISIQLMFDAFWGRICRLIGRPELASDPMFSTFHARRENAELLDTIVIQWTIEHTQEEIYQAAQKERVTAGYLAKIPALFLSPQLQYRGFFQEVPHHAAGTHRYPGAPYKVDDLSPQLGPAPALGEHNFDVYCRELGRSPSDLADLRESGVV
ncbi:MAG: CoA transferase [Dehalococcoidia bacterium]|nr:CoA transferase [Dehalococcoidia bacterium]